MHFPVEKIAILIMYVDDIVLIGSSTAKMNKLKEFLAKEFEIKDLENLKYFLGMEVAQTKKGNMYLISLRKVK